MALRAKKNPAARVPPQNVEAEMSVLGSLMLDKEAIYRIADFLNPRDFYKNEHRVIYEAMLELWAKHTPIDLISLTSRLKERGNLTGVGGNSYVTSLVNTVPTASHVVHYAKSVQQKRILRDLIEASHHIGELGYREEAEVESLLDEAEQKIFGIAKDTFKTDFFPVSQGLSEAWERIERVHKGDGELRGVPTGFKELDHKLGGLQKSDLVVLAARPSLGKTSLALNIARNIAVDAKLPVGVFSLEMSKEQLVDRLLASEAHINLWSLRTGHLSDEGENSDFDRIREAMDILSKAPIFIDDVASPTVMQIRAMARRLHSEHKIALLIVDYLQLIKGNDRAENRVQEVSEISRSLKALAKELNIPVLAVSQLSRAVEMRTDARPKLSDLRESGSIEQDADVVMFIYREDKTKKNPDPSTQNIAEIMIEKHRNGPTGIAQLYFHPEEASFRPIERNYDESPF
ncbi:MAG: replicative DNA helicase [Candidatus Sungbacteria bacterium RIFCSPHIGHO2_01_FULL_47_32]|uniref:Replicative DNA helicase n=1 Tax=Candidatus Sungbacteria bacterium RIFCSPHIGHO2_01_FULL_47_32 TaxID=1802264 RepID=A0A1G2K5Y2_9BACT|nr:MAG: Replicative DNA helicase [Parcubacteria group bacterium GW2011_GWA2_47_10]OGZ94842.1 MAG: replicative DNA helicase [Candidatus Sungbacteria bacterium RIFCSPHIGHO2_01_FULL_47_32]OGZ99015.1 MAG: replicative DNA helicase [Candidatus Sungbacteria bacterium RIFCSPHIGHO2_02_FULL_46_12]